MSVMNLGVTGAARPGSTVARGLQVHGYYELARRMDDNLVGLVAKSGFREYFHPRTGRGHGTRGFSWSAALLIHVLVGSER
jgi:hypothetical protein